MSSLSVLPISTLMHALMSVDPDARALGFWEVLRPSPPPGISAEDDPRRALADADWREINAKMPKWLHCHPYNDMLGDGLPEDERTWAFDFRVMTPTAWRSEEHTSELQSLMRISYAVFCLKKKKQRETKQT